MKFVFLLVTFGSFEIPDAPVPLQIKRNSAGPRAALRAPAGYFWTPGPSLLVARCASGLQTAKKSQSPKHDTYRKYSCLSEFFADGRDRKHGYRSRQLTDSPRIGSQGPGKICSLTGVNIFRVRIFRNAPNLHGKLLSVEKE